MGAIIRLDSKTLIKKFIQEADPAEFQFVLVSENITTKGKADNVKSFPRLIPPVTAITEFINGDKKAYKKAYLTYLKVPDVEAYISILIKAMITNDFKIVFVCSETEAELVYLDIICQHIENTFGLKTYTFKEYMKNPEKANKIKNKDGISAILVKKFADMQKYGVDLSDNVNKGAIKKQLKKMNRKELKKLAESKNIHVNDDMDKKDILKILKKKIAG